MLNKLNEKASFTMIIYEVNFKKLSILYFQTPLDYYLTLKV